MSGLRIWTVYENPSDFPGQFVARLFTLKGPTPHIITASTLEGLRAALPPGLVCLARDPGDDPVIVESWL